MPTLLAIEVSPRFENSISRKLTARFIEHWKTVHPTGQVVRRDLMKTRLPFIDISWIGGAFTPPEQQPPEFREAIRVSDELTTELMAADHVVIGTPMYNFSIPAVLKAYIDHVVRFGVTLTKQFGGALQGKKATVILASGNNYAIGTKWESRDSASTYLKQILGYMGITEVAVVLAGRTLDVDKGQTAFSDFAAQYETQLFDAARA